MDLLHFAEHRLQEAALVFMAVVYTLRILWLLKFKAGKERQAPTGLAGTTPKKGIIYSWANIAMPWAMESTRREFVLWLQFAIFHTAVAMSILMSFAIPYAGGIMEYEFIVRPLQLLFGLAFLIGCYRIYRRVSQPVMRIISSPDDYFSLILLTAWFAFALLAAPNKNDTALLIYFFMTAFFLCYVPFSKISHYLYYPFTRYYFGKSMGYRGVYPIKHDPEHKSASRA